ncbi:putative NADH2 dehydrogenase 40K chain [Tilletiaria anomala UBC 951]|uniref:Putative NADH2 dehydrogenase 40K chain n=1 Tax=Tilletiaria anomala (strain ATCC 24038 / CBS 436.72 / UBC 951) TaxID=1037660 RepID=A0A066VH53_TILAU|nr:putative NADH2 dehydrogenase 40K chain [Tilletiaria anomala UBC 951]KDN41067.1 putative NADH2 dehydrogenase 40K chain [Tilletiaria anomala UBC 951]
MLSVSSGCALLARNSPRSVLAASSSTLGSIGAASLQIQQRRFGHDLTIKRKTGKPVIEAGPYGGGRNSVSGHVATVFGCTGFLGRYLVSRLAQKGTQVIVPFRDEDEKRHLKIMGDLGQVVPMEWDIRDEGMIEECLRHSDTVYNLTGRAYETKNFSFADVNRDGARRIAEVAEASGVSRFIHVSHLNADANSESVFLRTKAEGEEAVRAAFPGATIVRPGPLYGHEDRLLNSIASWPITWHINYGQTRLRPTHSLNVAQALELMMDADNTAIGQTFSLANHRTYTISELMHLVESLTMNKIVRQSVNIPKLAITAAAKVGDLAWWQMLSPDELQRRYMDDKPDAPGTKSWADLGIEPDVLEEIAIVYLRRYRSHLYFEQPVENSGLRLKKEPYRVVD